MKYSYNYSKLLGRLREMGLTQSELAEKIGISEASLNYRLRGKTEFKQSEMLKVLDVVDVDMSALPTYFFAH